MRFDDEDQGDSKVLTNEMDTGENLEDRGTRETNIGIRNSHNSVQRQ